MIKVIYSAGVLSASYVGELGLNPSGSLALVTQMKEEEITNSKITFHQLA